MGTIVGSAVFNILFVIGLCGILVTQVSILIYCSRSFSGHLNHGVKENI